MSQPSKAFIIGNGLSRKGFDVRRLLSRGGPVIGCNGLYREMWPDILVAIDPEMIAEIRGSDFPQHRFVVPPEPEHAEASGSGRRSNAGMNAMHEAIKRGYSHLICLGFDFLVEGNDDATRTMYDGSPGYSPDRRATDDDNDHRTRYLDWFSSTAFPWVTFDFVFPRAAMALRSVSGRNVRAIFYDDFEATLGDDVARGRELAVIE